MFHSTQSSVGLNRAGQGWGFIPTCLSDSLNGWACVVVAGGGPIGISRLSQLATSGEEVAGAARGSRQVAALGGEVAGVAECQYTFCHCRSCSQALQEALGS